MEIDTPFADQDEEPLYYTFRPGNAQELMRLVRGAFAESVYPGEGDRDLIVSGYPECCAECGETHALFQDKSWREVAESGEPQQNFGWGGLALLAPQAWRYYLPAYLSVSLSGGKGAENALECALYALTPWAPAGLPEAYVKPSAEWFSARAFDFSAPSWNASLHLPVPPRCRPRKTKTGAHWRPSGRAEPQWVPVNEEAYLLLRSFLPKGRIWSVGRAT